MRPRPVLDDLVQAGKAGRRKAGLCSENRHLLRRLDLTCSSARLASLAVDLRRLVDLQWLRSVIHGKVNNDPLSSPADSAQHGHVAVIAFQCSYFAAASLSRKPICLRFGVGGDMSSRIASKTTLN